MTAAQLLHMGFAYDSLVWVRTSLELSWRAIHIAKDPDALEQCKKRRDTRVAARRPAHDVQMGGDGDKIRGTEVRDDAEIPVPNDATVRLWQNIDGTYPWAIHDYDDWYAIGYNVCRSTRAAVGDMSTFCLPFSDGYPDICGASPPSGASASSVITSSSDAATVSDGEAWVQTPVETTCNIGSEP